MTGQIEPGRKPEQKYRVGGVKGMPCSCRMRKMPGTFPVCHHLVAIHRLTGIRLRYWPNSVVINVVLCDYFDLGGQETNEQSLMTFVLFLCFSFRLWRKLYKCLVCCPSMSHSLSAFYSFWLLCVLCMPEHLRTLRGHRLISGIFLNCSPPQFFWTGSLTGSSHLCLLGLQAHPDWPGF